MKLTEFSVKNYQFTVVFFLLLVAIGWSSLQSIPRTEDPQLSFPSYNIVVVNPGSNPVDLERLIARPLEDAIKELDDLTKLQTTIRDGVATWERAMKWA